MKAFLAQCVFQSLMVFNLVGVTLQASFKWPMVAAIGNGKRSQPRSGVYNPEVLDRQWTYRSLTDGPKLSLRQDGEAWFTPKPWRRSYLQTAVADGYLPTSNDGTRRTTTSFGDGDKSVHTGSYGIDTFLEELPVSADDGQQFEDLANLRDPAGYTGVLSLYRNSPLVSSLLGWKRREAVLHMLKERLREERESEFDEK